MFCSKSPLVVACKPLLRLIINISVVVYDVLAIFRSQTGNRAFRFRINGVCAVRLLRLHVVSEAFTSKPARRSARSMWKIAIAFFGRIGYTGSNRSIRIFGFGRQRRGICIGGLRCSRFFCAVFGHVRRNNIVCFFLGIWNSRKVWIICLAAHIVPLYVLRCATWWKTPHQSPAATASPRGGSLFAHPRTPRTQA